MKSLILILITLFASCTNSGNRRATVPTKVVTVINCTGTLNIEVTEFGRIVSTKTYTTSGATVDIVNHKLDSLSNLK